MKTYRFILFFLFCLVPFNLNAVISVNLSGTTQISALLESSGNTYFNAATASTMCRALEAACVVDSEGTACGSTVYTDWRLPNVDDLSLFKGIAALDIADDNLLSSTPSTTNSRYVKMDMVYGSWEPGEYVQVRCVR